MNKVNTTKNLKDDEPIYLKGSWPLVEAFKKMSGKIAWQCTLKYI